MLLRIAGLSSSGFYKWRKADPHIQLDRINELKEHIQAVHAIRPQYGYRRMTWALRREGFLVNHKKVYSLMKKMGIKSVIRKKRNYGGKQGSNIFPNLLRRQFKSSKRYEKLVTDITYIPTQEGMMYLSVIQDLYNNEILSYQVSDRNDLSLVLNTINKLPSDVNDISILHSDQGMQYVNLEYRNVLNQKGIRGSHSRRGNCYDNACIESFFSHFKSETELVRNIADKNSYPIWYRSISDSIIKHDFKKGSASSPRWSTGKNWPLDSPPLGAFIPVYLTGGRPGFAGLSGILFGGNV